MNFGEQTEFRKYYTKLALDYIRYTFQLDFSMGQKMMLRRMVRESLDNRSNTSIKNSFDPAQDAVANYLVKFYGYKDVGKLIEIMNQVPCREVSIDLEKTMRLYRWKFKQITHKVCFIQSG